MAIAVSFAWAAVGTAPAGANPGVVFYEIEMPVGCRSCGGDGKLVKSGTRPSRAYTMNDDYQWEAPCRSCGQRGYRKKWVRVPMPRGTVLTGPSVRRAR
jgi:hypothetical protein